MKSEPANWLIFGIMLAASIWFGIALPEYVHDVRFAYSLGFTAGVIFFRMSYE